jgi:hypothetical protein
LADVLFVAAVVVVGTDSLGEKLVFEKWGIDGVL